MSDSTLTSRPKRDSGWHRDGKAKGIYWRKRERGPKAWGYYATQLGRIVQIEGNRQAAIDAKAQDGLRKSAGTPPPDTRVLIRDLVEQVRERAECKTRRSSFAVTSRALDMIEAEVGHLKVTQLGPERIERLERDLIDGKITGRRLTVASARRYLVPLSLIFKLAVRRGIIAASPMPSVEREASTEPKRKKFEWSPDSISKLVDAAEGLAARPESRYDYAPLIRVLVTLGLRVGEALALRWCDVRLLEAELHVEHTWGRDGDDRLGPPKTSAGVRTVPLAPGMVDLFALLKADDAGEEDFVFSTTGKRPVSYFNFRRRGFQSALEGAELDGHGITIHDLRSAAVSLYAARGLTMLEVAEVMGQSDPHVTGKHYARLFDRSNVAGRIREAQASLDSTD